MNNSESISSKDIMRSGLMLPEMLGDITRVVGKYIFKQWDINEHTPKAILDMFERGDSIPEEVLIANGMEPSFATEFANLVTTQGKNDALDKHIAGSGYTATWYMSLIDSTGYSAIVAGDTAASHAGWAEYTSYSESARPTPSWSAAASGTKSTSSSVTFTIPSTVTLKGAILISNSTKGGTSGVLYSAGLFTEGDRVINGAAVLTVSYSTSLT